MQESDGREGEEAEERSGGDKPLRADREHGRSSDAPCRGRRRRRGKDRKTDEECEGVCGERREKSGRGERRGRAGDRRSRSRERVCERSGEDGGEICAG